jgi:hypothetical protein
MNHPFERYCQCGVSAMYDFSTEGAFEQMLALWNKEHSGSRHGALSKAEFAAAKKRGEFNRAMAQPAAAEKDDSYF